MNANRKIIYEILETEETDPGSLERSKRKVMREMRILAPSKIDLLKEYHEMGIREKERVSAEAGIKFDEARDGRIKEMLVTRPVRSLSGVVNVSVLTKPYPCPGKCVYCPEEEGMPKSYLKSEPAAMRAAMNEFDPVKQVRVRLKGLQIAGHPVDKIEMRIVGGSWSSYPREYRHEFVKGLFDACNEKGSKDLKEAQRRNESSKRRMVGLSVETRPDMVTTDEIADLRELGVTSVELGVQAIDDRIIKMIKRGHDLGSVVEATRLLKEAGFKVCYQMMPNLPGSDIKRDEEMFAELFSNPDFRPDQLKIYPTATMKGTELYGMWKRGEYLPYSDEDLKSLLKRIKKGIPRYVRIQRLIRDIPAGEIEAGTTVSNVREMIAKEAERENWSCKCIRCREVKGFYDPLEESILFRDDYESSKGKEIFLTFESRDRKRLHSILRLRVSSKATIREIHTYGQQLGLSKGGRSPQHKGLGKKLLEKAEQVARDEFGFDRINVIAAIGTRNYYRKAGYRLNGTYMTKSLK